VTALRKARYKFALACQVQIAPAAHCVHACSLRRSELVAVALLLALALGGLDAHLLVVLLQGSEILAGL